MADVRTTALAILNEVKAKLPIKSRDNPQDFFKYTGGWTQKQLEDRWTNDKNLTCCNEFVSWYSKELAGRLGTPGLPMGNFSMEGWLAANNKHHAWVPAREGAKPFPGDIYRPKDYHMGVVYACADPGEFHSIDGGQGGPKSGQDIIDQLKRPFVVGNFLGWVDVEALYTKAAPVHPIPAWLVGWWEVTRQKSKSWYFFNNDYTVTRTPLPPPKGSKLPIAGEKIKFAVEFSSIFVLSWPKKDGHFVVEKFGPRPFAGTNTMEGERDGLVNLRAVRH